MQLRSDAARARAEALFKRGDQTPAAAQAGLQGPRPVPRAKRQQMAYLRALGLDAAAAARRKGKPPHIVQ